jgi:hypothetical protein
VFGAYVVVAQLEGLTKRWLEDLLGTRVNGGEPVIEAPAGPIVSSTATRAASSWIPREAKA